MSSDASTGNYSPTNGRPTTVQSCPSVRCFDRRRSSSNPGSRPGTVRRSGTPTSNILGSSGAAVMGASAMAPRRSSIAHLPRASTAGSSSGSRIGGPSRQPGISRTSSPKAKGGREITAKFPEGLSRYPASSEWSNKFRSAPEHLLDDWHAMSQPGKVAIVRTRNELMNGEDEAYLSSCVLMDSGAALLAEILRVHAMQLRIVNLQNNCISNDGAVQIARALDVGGGSVQVINVANNHIGDDGAKQFAALLAVHPFLKACNMDSNFVSDVGANTLIRALTANPRPDVACILTNNPVNRFNPDSLQDLAKPAQTINSLANLGITMGLLLKVFWKGMQNGTIVPGETTTGEVVQRIVLPACEGKRCSWVGLFARSKPNPSPTTHVIHAWDGLFEDLVRNVANHACGRPPGKRDPDMTLDPNDIHWKYSPQWTNQSYFIDAFCVNQRAHVDARARGPYARFVDTPAWRVGEPCCQIDKLHLVASKIVLQGGRLLLAVDSRNAVLTRIQCLYEIFAAVDGEMPMDVIFAALGNFSWTDRESLVQRSCASSDYMRQLVLDEVEKHHVGGFTSFNESVLLCMEQYAEVERRAHRRYDFT